MHAGEFLVKTKSGRAYLAVVGKSESAKSKSSKSSDYSNLNRNSTMGLGTGAMSQINPLSQEVGSEVPDEPRGPPKPSGPPKPRGPPMNQDLEHGKAVDPVSQDLDHVWKTLASDSPPLPEDLPSANEVEQVGTTEASDNPAPLVIDDLVMREKKKPDQ